jgi:hypothetical protein
MSKGGVTTARLMRSSLSRGLAEDHRPAPAGYRARRWLRVAAPVAMIVAACSQTACSSDIAAESGKHRSTAFEAHVRTLVANECHVRVQAITCSRAGSEWSCAFSGLGTRGLIDGTASKRATPGSATTLVC